ncbi:MAG: hypothetical protein ACYTG6_16840 [Planctomycetota bacterium]
MADGEKRILASVAAAICGVAAIYSVVGPSGGTALFAGGAECSVPEVLTTVEGPWKRAMAVTENFRQWMSFSGGGSVVRIARHERADASSGWESQESSYSTDLQLTDVGFSGSSQLYVAGVRRTSTGCEDVIERWTLEVAPGSYQLVCTTPTQPRGVPLSLPISSRLSEGIVGGGAYVPIDQRRFHQPIVTKEVLYAGDVGVISAIEMDPDGRFLLVQSHASGDVFSLDVAAPGSPLVLEFSATQHPQLAKTQDLVAYDHMTKGRLYEAREGNKHSGLVPSGVQYTFLRDADNDGAFETIEVLDPNAYMASPYFDNTLYRSLLNRGVTPP